MPTTRTATAWPRGWSGVIVKDRLYWQLRHDDTIVDRNLCGRMPIVPIGDSSDWNGYRIAVLRADRKRARLLPVRKA